MFFWSSLKKQIKKKKNHQNHVPLFLSGKEAEEKKIEWRKLFILLSSVKATIKEGYEENKKNKSTNIILIGKAEKNKIKRKLFILFVICKSNKKRWLRRK